jgi:uncharacterized protein YlaI
MSNPRKPMCKNNSGTKMIKNDTLEETKDENWNPLRIFLCQESQKSQRLRGQTRQKHIPSQILTGQKTYPLGRHVPCRHSIYVSAPPPLNADADVSTFEPVPPPPIEKSTIFKPFFIVILHLADMMI